MRSKYKKLSIDDIGESVGLNRTLGSIGKLDKCDLNENYIKRTINPHKYLVVYHRKRNKNDYNWAEVYETGEMIPIEDDIVSSYLDIIHTYLGKRKFWDNVKTKR